MNGSRTALTVQLGVLLSAIFLLLPACSMTPVRGTVPAESVVKAQATVTVEEPQVNAPPPQVPDQLEAILCDSHASQQTPECEGYQHHKAGQIEVAIEKYKTALALAKEANDTRKAAFLSLLLGIAHIRPGQTEVAINYYRQAVASFMEIGDTARVIGSLYVLGDTLLALGQYENALASYLETFAIAKNQIQLEKNSDKEFATALVSKAAAAAIQLEKYEEAIKVLNEAAEIFKQRDETRLKAREFYLIASKLSSEKLKDNRQALEYSTKAFQLRLVDKDASLECEMHYQLSTLYYETKNYEKALPFLERALDLCEEANNSKRTFEILSTFGLMDKEQNRLDKALVYFEKALKVYQDLKENLGEQEKSTFRLTEGIILFSVGQIQDNLEQYEKAIEFYRQAIKTFQQDVGNKHLELGVLAALSLTYANLGKFQEALFLWQQIREVQRELKDSAAEAETLITLAKLSDTLGDVDNVQKYFLEALELYQQIGNLQQEALVLAEIGRLHQDMSQYDKALNSYYQALSKYQEAKDRKGQREVLARIGEVYRWIGDNEAALQWYQYALETSRAAKDAAGEAQALARLLLVDAWLGKEETLKEHVSQAPKAEKEIGDRIRLGVQRGNLAQDDILAFARLYQVTGEIFARWGPPDQAISALNLALQIHRALPRTREFLKETAIDLCFLGAAYSRLQQYDEALKALQHAANIAQQLHSPEIYWILNGMGFVHEQQGKFQEALDLYTQATEVLEKVSFQQRLEEVELPVRDIAFNVYLNILRLLHKLYIQTHDRHYLEQAFFYYEKGKARVLLDLLEKAKVRIREGTDPALLKEEEQITTRISRLHRALANPKLPKDQERQLLATLAEREQARQALRVKMAVANPKYAELTSPQIAGIQQVQAILDKETLLLEYALGKEKSFLWGVTQDGVQAYELSAEETITQLVEQYLSTLREPLYGEDEIERHSELGRKLYHTLLQPAANQLQGKSKLIIVPDGSLYNLPFEALIADDGRSSSEKGKEELWSLPYLVNDYTITYTPSASVLVTLETNHSKRHREEAPPQAPVLAFGDPLYEAALEPHTVALNLRSSYEQRGGGGGFQRLQYSAEEIQKIAGVYGITLPSDAVNLRERATEKRLREMDLTRYRILHFATHAILSDEVKWITQPALVLSLTGTDDTYNGFLQMGEIFNLRLNADLVVLSACDTGRGKLYRGEGVVGLTRAFMYAGTSSVVASLWKVNDPSTNRFMEFFYRNLKEGQSKAEALRQAKKQLMQEHIKLGGEQPLAAPYFWAPFILVGSGNRLGRSETISRIEGGESN